MVGLLVLPLGPQVVAFGRASMQGWINSLSSLVLRLIKVTGCVSSMIRGAPPNLSAIHFPHVTILQNAKEVRSEITW